LALETVAGMNQRRPDKDRFANLMRPHFDALFAAAMRFVGSTMDAEDLVQEVCLKALAHIDELEEIEYPRAWLLKVLYNEFVDRHRSRSRSPVDMADTGVDSFDPETLLGGGVRPDDVVDRDARLDSVVRAMSILDKESSSMLALHDIEGFSLEELRAMTGMPIGTIKSRLHRTRSKLGRLLSNEALARPALTVVRSKK